jgi:two-component sensor histidine kinase
VLESERKRIPDAQKLVRFPLYTDAELGMHVNEAVKNALEKRIHVTVSSFYC